MKVTIVNARDKIGGAARSSYRLHRGLLENGQESQMLVQRKFSGDPNVKAAYSNSHLGELYGKIRPYFNTALQKIQGSTNPVLHSANILPSGLHRKINNSDADIVHLHWIGHEMISIAEIAKIKKPIVWTLHDMWAFSGGEHLEDLKHPGRYREGYKKSNRPAEYEKIDLDRVIWDKKRRHWRDKDFTVVTPSNWLAECARDSVLFGDKRVKVIPNGIDLDVYKPIPPKIARYILNIDSEENKKYILFGAMSAESDPNKGFYELKKALKELADSIDGNDYSLIIFGSEGYGADELDLPVQYLGRLNDDETLALAYSAADVMVVPSRQENLPNTAVEATACGTPVVAFDIGGLSDIVTHQRNGYLAEPYDPGDLARGIEWVLEYGDNQKLSENARNKALENFDLDKVAKQYISLYRKVINKNK